MYRKITASLVGLSMLLLLPAQAFAALAFFQSTTCSGTVTPVVSTAFSSPVVVGDLIVVTEADDTGADQSATMTVTDNGSGGSNTYHQIATTGANDTGTESMWYAVVTHGGSSLTVSIADSAGFARISCVAQEFNGFTGTPTFDKISAFTNGNSTAALSLTSGTLSNANEVAVGGFSHYATISAFTLGAGYTNLGTVNVANAASAQESKIVSVTTAVTAGATIAAAREWNAYVATFFDQQSVASTPKPVLKITGGLFRVTGGTLKIKTDN